MASNRRIENVSNGHRLKPQHAERAILNGAAEWVERGVSIRSLTLAESIVARNEQAKLSEPLAYAELPGLMYEPAVSGQMASSASAVLVRAAHEWAMRAA